MTASLNRIQLIGNIGAEPKTIAGKDGKTFVTATLATNESFKQGDEWQTSVQWHQLVLFGKQINIAEYLKKGSLVFVEGKLRSSQWTDNDGNTRHNINVIVNNMQLLGHSKSADELSSQTASDHMAQMREKLQ